MERAPDEVVRVFLRHVRTGAIDDVRAMLGATPSLVHAVGPHPFWGGRPQALHLAIEGKRRDLFDLLLGHGADVNGVNDGYDHWSPLMLALSADQGEMRDELLRRGARVGLVEALMMEDDGRVDELLHDDALARQSATRDGGPNRGSILAFARTPFAIDRLLALGAPADVKDRWGSTPIDAISRLGARGQALVRHLVARGIAATPAEYARLGDVDTLARLVESDPAIARLDAVMMGAVDFRHHGLVTWLLERGGSANARAESTSRHTALHSAAWNGDLEMVVLLVRAGADRSARDEEHDGTPLGWAETSIEVTGNQACAEVVAFLRSRPPND
jgi:ankyrin repeat protein